MAKPLKISPEETGPEHGIWNSNANMLTRNAPPHDPTMGTYHLMAVLCKIYREENLAPLRSSNAMSSIAADGLKFEGRPLLFIELHEK
jgi:hypothetical protein